MEFEFLSPYNLPGQPIVHLLREKDSKTLAIITNEWTRLLGYSRPIKWSGTPNADLYRLIVTKQNLLKLKQCLHSNNIFEFRRSTRLSLITEFGFMYWAGITRYEPIFRLAPWLFQAIFLNHRPYTKPLYVQNIYSNAIGRSFHIWIHNGRIGILEPDLHAILTEPDLDYVSLICDCYIAKLHFITWNLPFYRDLRKEIHSLPDYQNGSLYFLYESGVYRYLHHHRDNPRAEQFLHIWEQEILPTLLSFEYWYAIETPMPIFPLFSYGSSDTFSSPQSSFDTLHNFSHVLIPTSPMPTPPPVSMIPSDIINQQPLPTMSEHKPTIIAAESSVGWDITSGKIPQMILGYIQRLSESFQQFAQRTDQILSRLQHNNDIFCEHLARNDDMMKSGFKELEELIKQSQITNALPKPSEPKLLENES